MYFLLRRGGGGVYLYIARAKDVVEACKLAEDEARKTPEQAENLIVWNGSGETILVGLKAISEYLRVLDVLSSETQQLPILLRRQAG